MLRPQARALALAGTASHSGGRVASISSTAFAAFEAFRRARVEKLIAQAKRTSNQKIPNPLTRALRDRVILPLVGRAAARTTRDWITDHRIDWDAPADQASPRA